MSRERGGGEGEEAKKGIREDPSTFSFSQAKRQRGTQTYGHPVAHRLRCFMAPNRGKLPFCSVQTEVTLSGL